MEAKKKKTKLFKRETRMFFIVFFRCSFIFFFSQSFFSSFTIKLHPFSSMKEKKKHKVLHIQCDKYAIMGNVETQKNFFRCVLRTKVNFASLDDAMKKNEKSQQFSLDKFDFLLCFFFLSSPQPRMPMKKKVLRPIPIEIYRL